ncbi:MAG: HD domain-containing protein [Deltaproteobacteria bacterium]|nr:HD domain-containing protein [Deltaproteobacteria bacterium]
MQDITQQFQETDTLAIETVKSLAIVSEVNDEDAGQHIHRFGLYCKLLAEHCNMSSYDIKTIQLQSQLHDVGKIYIPQSILRKITPLTPEEWEIVKMHTIHGARIIGDHPRMKMARNIALTHHERWNGTGHPNGLKGEEIPIEGRIAGLADTYDTLRMKRSYKEAYDHATACRIILEGDGKSTPDAFDPNLLLLFKQFHWQFNDIFEANP